MDWTKEVNLSSKPVAVGKDGTWWVDITGPAYAGDPVRNVLSFRAMNLGLRLLEVNWWTRKVKVTVY